MNKMIEFTVLT